MPQDNQTPQPNLSDDDLAWSMVVFMETHGGERMLRATAKACKLISEKSASELDGTSAQVWEEARKRVASAAQYLEEN